MHGNRSNIVALDRQSTQAALSSRMASVTDLQPVSREEFAAELVPCLALVSGAGMNTEARREWLNAAYKALHGIPIALLKRGAADAMLKADHPSKIIPAITASIGADWKWRREHSARNAEIEAAKRETVALLARPEVCTPEQARQIIEEVGLKREAMRADAPPPTVADYVALGLSEDEAREIIAKQEAAKASDKTVGKALAA